jgi:adenylate cyclase
MSTIAPKINAKLGYSKKEIRAQLHCILSSDLFSHSSVLSSFLKFIVEETLEGNTDGLKEYTIAVSALGKNPDFNPQIDAIVRIHAGRLRRSLQEYYTGPGLTDPIMIEVVKGTYVPVFRSQIYIKQNGKAVENEKPPQYSRSKLTLAVLPFRNLCPDNEYQFFAEGFGEELTRIFSTCQDIDVIAHHSMRKYNAASADIRGIGNELGVHYLITGSVMRSSKEIRVSVGLAETLNGRQIWSKNYRHVLEIDKFIDIQDEINDDVFSILSGHYGFIIRDTMKAAQSTKKLDLTSFDAILWNYHAQMTHSLEACITTRKVLEKAIQNDPDNVMCLVVLGDLYLYSYTLGFPTVEDPVNEAYQLIKKAIIIDPLSQYAHTIFGWANIYMHRKKEAIEAFDYSLQLGLSSASVKGTLGFGLACAGEYQRAHALLNESLTLNPYCPWWYYMGFFFVFYNNRQYKEALECAQKMDASDDVFLKPLLTAAAKGQLGLIREAQVEVEILTKQFPEIIDNLKMSLGTFMLDDALIVDIMEGVKKADLFIA